MRRVVVLLALLATTQSLGAQVVTEQEGIPIPKGFLAETYVLPGFLSVKVMKTHADSVPWSVTFPSCGSCALISNQFTAGQDTRVFFFHIRAPTTVPSVRLHLKVNPSDIRAIVVGRTRVNYTREANGITFDAPLTDPALAVLPWYDSDDATESYTYLESNDVEIRLEHADIRRRRGYYATGPWPAVQRQAALNLEFASREALRALGVDRLVHEQGLGVICIMGFDTNYPTQGPDVAHEDAPPHWHIFVVWSERPKSRETAHYYINPDGLLDSDLVSNDVTNAVTRFKRGETHPTPMPDGTALYTDQITPDGAFVIAMHDASCRLTPVGKGFDSGVNVACDHDPQTRRVLARDDIDQGVVRVFINDALREAYAYDLDTQMLSRSDIKW